MISTQGASASGTRRVRIVSLRAFDGRYLAVAPNQLVAKAEPDGFALAPTGADRVTLQSLRTGTFVSANADGEVAAFRTESGSDETFTLARVGGDAVRLRAPNGRYLTAPAGNAAATANAQAAGEHETFVVEAHELALDELVAPGCCCGLRRDPSQRAGSEDAVPKPMWNDNTHRRIVETAVERIAAWPKPTPESQLVTWFFSSAPGFYDQVRKYLRLADYDARYAGTKIFGDVFTYIPHFYDPATGTSYTNGDITAVSYGRRFFNLSVYHARLLKYGNGGAAAAAKAGQYLGVTLHYLTDLTQPMHAANFANIFGEFQHSSFPTPNLLDKRHAGFEDYAEARILAGFLDGVQLSERDFDIAGIAGADHYLIATATANRNVFQADVLAEARKKRRSWLDFDNTWGAEADPALGRALWPAPNVTARFLNYWARCVDRLLPNERPVRIDKWYRITEPTSGYREWVFLRDKYHMAGTDAGDTARFFFLYNEDGTCSLACAAKKNNLWSIYSGWADVYVSADTSRPPAQSARFRVTPDPSGAVMFYEQADDMAVAVSRSGTSSGYLVRRDPTDPQTFLFRLEELADITPAEAAEIKQLWPAYGQYGPAVPPR